MEQFTDFQPSGDSPLSIGSSRVVGTAPTQASSEVARRLWLNYDAIERLPGGIWYNSRDTCGGIETKSSGTWQSSVAKGSRKQMFKSPRSIIAVRTSRGAQPQGKETDLPDSHCPPLSHSNWWARFGQWYTGGPERAVEKALAKHFRGLVVERNTYEDDMNHEEKAHQHHIIAIEAEIPLGRFDHCVGRKTLRGTAEFSDNQSTAIDPFSETVPTSDIIATSILLYSSQLLLDRESSSLTYTVDEQWCLSEIIRARFDSLARLHEGEDWLEAVITSAYESRLFLCAILGPAYDRFVELVALHFCAELVPELGILDIEHAKVLGIIGSGAIYHLEDNGSVMELGFLKLFFCCNFVASLICLFDPLANGNCMGVPQKDSLDQLMMNFQQLLGILEIAEAEIDVYELASAVFKHVTALRYAQTFPLHIWKNLLTIDLGNGCKGLEVSSEYTWAVGNDELVWTCAWGTFYLFGPLFKQSSAGRMPALPLLEAEELD